MSRGSLRILHLTTELPTKAGISGGSTRQFHLLASLAEQGNCVTVVSPVTADQHGLNPVEALEAVGVRLVATRRHASRELEALSSLRRRPALAWRAAVVPFYAAQTEMLAVDMVRRIAQAVPSQPDVVSIEHDFSAALGDDLSWDVPRVLTVQNVTAAYYARRASTGGWLQGVAYTTEAWRADRYISPRFARYARLIAMSEADAELLRARTNTEIDVVPNGAVIGPVLAPVGGQATVLFTGTMSHPPNREGIVWFHTAVWPQVRRELPDVRLVIVGRHPHTDVLALADSDPSVQVAGEVPDLTPYFAAATVVVAPLHSGSGTRLKILDAFAAGRAVVATSVGAEGLETKDGEHLAIANDAAGFAAATLRLLTDSSLREDIAAGGRQLAEARYDWGSLGTRLGEILHSVAEGRQRGQVTSRTSEGQPRVG